MILSRSVLFLSLLQASCATQNVGLKVSRLNSDEKNQRIKDQRDVRFQLLWGDTEDEDWDKFESFRRFLGDSSHSYSSSLSDDNDNGHSNGHDLSGPATDDYFQLPTASPVETTEPSSLVEFKFPTTSPTEITDPSTIAAEFKSPTTSPVDNTTDAPTPTPSLSPISEPTTEPTKNSKITEQSTEVPALTSSIRSCYTNPSTGEPEMGNTTTSTLNFAYVAELKESTTSFVAPLEQKMLESVATFLNCDDGNRRHLQLVYESPIVAIDSTPSDRILPSAPCEVTNPSASKCVVVLGYMTLGFSEDFKRETKRQILIQVKEKFNTGAYLDPNTSPELVQLNYLGPEVEGDFTDLNLSAYEIAFRNTGSTAILISASLMLLASAAIITITKRHRGKNQHELDEDSWVSEDCSCFSAVIFIKSMSNAVTSEITSATNETERHDGSNRSDDTADSAIAFDEGDDIDLALQRQDASRDIPECLDVHEMVEV